MWGKGARRNIGILAHIDAGKTTVTEHLLHVGGVVRRPGSVDQGTTVSDWLVEEQERGITISSAASSFAWREVAVSVVDTPGHVDFTIEVERSLRVLDGAVVVISGPDGVQAQTETVWVQATRHRIPAIGFVNKLDREGHDLDLLERQIRERLAVTPVWLELPILDRGPGVVAVIDVLRGVIRVCDLADASPSAPPEPAEEPLDEVSALRRRDALDAIIDAAASFDDAYAELVLSGGEPTPSQHLSALRAAVRARAVLPLCAGAARFGLGIDGLADAIVDLLPSPDEREVHALDAHGEPTSELGAGPVAYVFKTEARAKGVHLAFVRVFAGAIEAGAPLFVAPHARPLEGALLVDVEGQDYAPIARLEAGGIGALAFGSGANWPSTGDTIGGVELAVTFERVKPPEPVLEMIVEAAETEIHERMLKAIAELCADDPSLRSGIDRESGRAVLAGMGELHLEIAVQRLEREVGTKISASRPKVRARHLLDGVGVGEATVHHPNGRARVRIEVEVAPIDGALERGRPGNSGPLLAIFAPPTERPEWREAVISGLESAAGLDGRGAWQLLGARLSVRVFETSGSDLVPVMCRDAAEWAALRAIEAAGVSGAEPWCVLTLIVPDAAVGRVVGDLMRRRARVRRTESRGRVQELTVDAPLAELLGYANDLRSMTAGRGQLSMEPVGYRGAARAES